MFKATFTIFCLLVQAAYSQSYFMELKTHAPDVLEEHLAAKGFDVAGVNRTKSLVGVVTQSPALVLEEKDRLDKFGAFSFEVVSQTASEPFQTYARRMVGNADDIPPYFNVEQTNEELNKLASLFPQYAKVFNLNQLVGADKTLEGREIFALHVSRTPAQITDSPKILIIGQHHAREITTQHAVLDSARDYLEKIVAGDPQMALAVQQSEVWFVPVLNPDGLTHVMKSDRMWRKNRAKNADGTRGVDLNRNYSFKWGTCGINSDQGSSEVYKGPKPMSEPEMRLMEKLNALLRFQYSISYHSYGDEILNPYLCGDLAEEETYFRLRNRLSSTLGYGLRPASSSGEDHEFHYNKFGTISFLIEIGEEFQPSFSVYQKTVLPKVNKVLPVVLEEALSQRVDFKVLDLDTGKPVVADLSLNEVSFKEGETRFSDSFGTFRWTLPKGSFSLAASAQGYEEALTSFQSTGKVDSVTVKLRSPRFSLNTLGLWAKFFP